MEETVSKKLSILLVDDDADDQDFFAEMLSEVSPETKFLSAADGVDALKMLQSKASLPDLIFLDLNMPRMGGKECLQHLNADNDLQKIPVVIYTTSTSPFDVKATKKAGVAGYIVKPTDVVVLKNMLAAITKSFPEQLPKVLREFSL